MISGQCFCGHVRYELSGEPKFACGDDLALTSGTISEYRSSPGVRRGHCAICGTTITYWWDKRPEEIDIALATLDDTTGIDPSAHIWVEDKVPWLVINDGLPQYKTTISAGEPA
jgi:hypothetical protein